MARGQQAFQDLKKWFLNLQTSEQGLVMLAAVLTLSFGLIGSGILDVNSETTYEADVTISITNLPLLSADVSMSQPSDYEREGVVSVGRLPTFGLEDQFIPSDDVRVNVQTSCNGEVVEEYSIQRTVTEGETQNIGETLSNLPADSRCVTELTAYEQENGNEEEVGSSQTTFRTPTG